MRELTDILRTYEAAIAARQRTALATVVRVTGSAYRRPGARLLIIEDGTTIGGISGGCLEADVALRAKKVLDSGVAQTACYDNTRDREQIFGVGGGCNGTIEILIEPLREKSAGNPMPILSGVLRSRRPAALVTVFETTGPALAAVGQRLARADGVDLACDVESPVLARWMRDQADGGVSGVQDFSLGQSRVSVAVEIIEPPPGLVVFGAGSDAMPLVNMARELGWFVTVADHRHTLATAARFPAADEIYSDPPEELIDQIGITADTAVVVMTHDFDRDRRLLKRLVGMPLAYLGVLGPARRTDRLLEGTSLAEAKVFSPIGLDLGAETPQEIALSILAEIQAVRSARIPRHLSDRPGPIHAMPKQTQSSPSVNRR